MKNKKNGNGLDIGVKVEENKERAGGGAEHLAGAEHLRNISKEDLTNINKIVDIDLRRRELFKTLAKASVSVGALAILESCVRKPEPEKLLPYLNVPENIIPGIPYWFATTCSGCPASCGILVKTEDGIPRKVEGNPDNPISGGKTCARGQGIIHQLYSPDRIKTPLVKREGGEFENISIDEAISLLADKVANTNPESIYIITGNTTGKTEKFYLEFANKIGIPEENIVRWETFSFAPIRYATKILFGREVVPIFRIDKADLIVSVSGDFLDAGPSTVLYSRWFAKFHSVEDEKSNVTKNRFVYVGPRMNLTGLNADKWIELEPSDEVKFCSLLFNILVDKSGKKEFEGYKINIGGEERIREEHLKDVQKIADMLLRASSPVFIPPSLGDATTGTVALLSMLINLLLGTIGKTVILEPGFNFDKLAPHRVIKELAEKMREGKVKLLLIHSFDPFYSTPPSLGLSSAVKNVPFIVSFTYHQDETLEYSHLVIPDRHPLEKWGDSEVIRGFISFYQPVVPPIFPETMQTEDVLILVANKVKEGAFVHPTFKDYLRAEYGLSDEQWVRALEIGGIFSETFDMLDSKLQEKGYIISELVSPEKVKSEIEASIRNKRNRGDGGKAKLGKLIIYPSYHLYDGRLANSPWLQEFFDVATRVAWRNVLEVGPKTAKELGLRNGDIVSVSSGAGSIELAVCVYQGTKEGFFAVSLGRGHKRYGRFATGRGANPLALVRAEFDVSGELSFVVDDVSVAKTGKRLKRLPKNEGVPRQLGRDIAHFTTVDILPQLSAEKKWKELEEINKKRFPRGDWEKYGRDSAKPSKYKWKMVIDLDRCIGCSACMIACQVENNIPFVGEEEVMIGREITWVRVERYWFSDDEIHEFAHGKNGHHHSMNRENPDAKKVVFVPMMCQQCEYAPCEYVCPVYATMHTSDGLNAQVYNRCVGTRFCANNCPYKVRYFNWLDYHLNVPEALTHVLNPDVTVRTKGVMEKCTFCVQRINFAIHNAKIEKRDVKDGEVIPACAQVCPADAITFGNIKDSSSEASKKMKSRRVNWALKELGTEPSITYLEKVFAVDET